MLWETHPFLEMFKPDRDRIRDDDNTIEMHYSYFMREPVKLESGLDYYSNEIEQDSVAPLWYHHSLSYVIQSIISAGFNVQKFTEYDFDNSIGYRHVEHFDIRPPMSFILVARGI